MTGAFADPVERDTPLLCIDVDAVERNIRGLQAHCDTWGLACRPHVKTHKLPQIAHLQRSHGAVGITCQKLGEATAMIDAGMDDVLLAFPIVGEDKLRRLARLARRANLGVVGDDAETVSAMAAALATDGATAQFFVECDTGLARTGVQSPEDAAALATHAAGLNSLIFRGLMTYPTPSDGGRWLGAARSACEARGLVVSVVSGGGTADAFTTTASGWAHRAARRHVRLRGSRLHRERQRLVCRLRPAHPRDGRQSADARTGNSRCRLEGPYDRPG